jgi:hypothetical protein
VERTLKQGGKGEPCPPLFLFKKIVTARLGRFVLFCQGARGRGGAFLPGGRRSAGTQSCLAHDRAKTKTPGGVGCPSQLFRRNGTVQYIHTYSSSEPLLHVTKFVRRERKTGTSHFGQKRDYLIHTILSPREIVEGEMSKNGLGRGTRARHDQPMHGQAFNSRVHLNCRQSWQWRPV